MEEKQKTTGEKRREALLYQQKNGYDCLSPADESAMRAYSEDYKKFLDSSMTEREAVDTAISLAEARGFKPLVRGMELRPGDKVYRSNRGKAVMLAVVGSQPLDQGAKIGAAHIDSPRLDLKPSPLYEDAELAFLKTHYYGGIRKYQWVTIPLELHGVVALKDGSVVKVAIGSAAGDPLFTIDDLLPHLGAEQSKKPLGEAIPGENLNILVGSRPFQDDEGDQRVKLAIMDILNQKYGIVEEDFISAELSVVPAFHARTSALTALSSALMAMMTGCAPMPLWLRCWIWRRRRPGPPYACWQTRKRSDQRASRGCSLRPLTPLCPTCATRKRCP